MEYHFIEGTWEEVLAHTPELSGHRVRVTILENEPLETHSLSPKNLAEALMGRVGRLSFDVPDFANKAEDLFTDILVEKHKRRFDSDPL
ncbi:hypothetical protein C7H19_24885 [Aphanothece hegewaldii CCALA 016]|uniref:Uncharacterized protein n=1 Tax=Aphanothece hegewaldii CCALA 016 TaxID=2107694 RepID=A0A2T1LQG7_9CHRO|nr:hypothetical protein [Aphanothece hegewaldii]PSF27797.1 hypothetical protein C7H19_24885 [Aphanothece hegewaldii CCALA 016]